MKKLFVCEKENNQIRVVKWMKKWFSNKPTDWSRSKETLKVKGTNFQLFKIELESVLVEFPIYFGDLLWRHRDWGQRYFNVCGENEKKFIKLDYAISVALAVDDEVI